jgi:hypothetical protein
VSVSVLTWKADDDRPRYEQARISTEPGRLQARGTVIVGESDRGAAPYRLDYELDTIEEYMTHRLVVRAEGRDWRRELWLRREADGSWSARRLAEPDLHEVTLDVADVTGALDCDLGECPLTNTMPVLRHGLHRQPGRHEFLMAWVRVPDLVVLPSIQTYEHARTAEDGGGATRYQSERFETEIAFDPDGFVTRYPGLATRV